MCVSPHAQQYIYTAIIECMGNNYYNKAIFLLKCCIIVLNLFNAYIKNMDDFIHGIPVYILFLP